MSGKRGSSHKKKKPGPSTFSSDWRNKENRNPDQAVEPTHRESADKERDEQATQDGRRLWVGNLPLAVNADDVRALFTDSMYEVDYISISSPSFKGLNPYWCYVDLHTKEQADEAIRQLDETQVSDKVVKIRLAAKQSNGEASNLHGSSSSSSRGGPRVFVGGLPLITAKLDVDTGVQELFKGYDVKHFGKLKIPPDRDPRNPEKQGRNDCYLFVDLATAKEAERVVKELHGREGWGVPVRVRKARPPGRDRDSQAED